MRPIQVFIGYDPRQPVAYQVAAHSIARRATGPVSITRLQLSQLPITRTGLTQFTYSRFLAPYLSGFEGISIFLDADVLCLGDIGELLAYPMAYPDTAVFVSKGPKRFEWASVMVFNNARCTMLTPDYIENPAHVLFNFSWAETVGELPASWNHLVGYDAPNPDAKLVHFTQGIPCWPETKDCEFSAAWHEELQHSCSTVSFKTLMGRSVHVPHMKQVAR